MYIPSGDLLAMALAAQGQRPTTNQQQPNFNWAQVAGPPGGSDDGGQMALTMPMPAPVAVPVAAPVAAPMAVPVMPPSDVVYQQMYAPPPQEMVQMPAPVYSMIPATPQPQPQMEPINFPQPSMADLAAYEMYGAPVVPVAGYSPLSQAPVAPQQFSWQPMAEQAQPVGYNPMLMDAAAMELYGAPSQVPMQPAAVPTQFAFDPASLTGSAGATFMQTPTAMPQQMMAGGPPQQNLAPLPPPPSMYVPRQQQEVAGMTQPGVGATMPYQPMIDLGVSQEELYNMFAGMEPQQQLALASRLDTEGGTPAQQQPATTVAAPVGGAPVQPQAQGQVATQPQQQAPAGKFTREFKPFDFPITTSSGTEIKAKVVAYDPQQGSATLQYPNGSTARINKASAGGAKFFPKIEEEFAKQQTEQSKYGPGDFEMVGSAPNMPLRVLIQDQADPEGKRNIWVPGRQTADGRRVEYYDPNLETTVELGLSELPPGAVYDPDTTQAAMGAPPIDARLHQNLVAATVDKAAGGYAREVENDNKAFYTPSQLSAMTQVVVDSVDANGIPKYKVVPITVFQQGVREEEDENGNISKVEFAEEVADPRVPPGYIEGLQLNLDRKMEDFRQLGDINQQFVDAKPEQLSEVRTKRLQLALDMAIEEQKSLNPTSKEYKAKQKEIDSLREQVKDSLTDMTMRLGDATILTAQAAEKRVANYNPKSWSTIIQQHTGGLAGSGAGSASRPGVILSPQQFAENFVENYAQGMNYERGKVVDLQRSGEYNNASSMLINHLSEGVQQAIQAATGGDPKKIEKFVEDLYSKQSRVFQSDGRGGGKFVQQKFFDAVKELEDAQREMNSALRFGEKKRITAAEKKLRAAIDKMRSQITLPDGSKIVMSEEAYNQFEPNRLRTLYEASASYDPTIAGLETQTMQTTTIQPEKIEGTPDRARTGTPPPNATSIRPAIIGAGSTGYYGDETGVLRASTADPNQYAHIAAELRRGKIIDFTKNVMLAGMYGEIGPGFTNADNKAAAENLFKAANLLMTEDSPAGKEMRKAYAISLWNILNKTADFQLSDNETDFAALMEDAYQTGDASRLLARIEADKNRIAGRAAGRNIFTAMKRSPYPGYFTTNQATATPQETFLFQSALNRVKSAAVAYAKAKTLPNAGSALGIKDIDTQQYVFFASPWDTSRRSLLAIPSIDSGSGAGAAVLTKAQTDQLEANKQLPTNPMAYDIPATFAQLNSSLIFGTLNEAMGRELPKSTNPQVKDALDDISKRQSANHVKDMSSAQARRARNETNTTLDQNGKDIGRRWVIEGALMWNVMHPTRNLIFVP